jgi:Family of unknown function (DUF6599)
MTGNHKSDHHKRDSSPRERRLSIALLAVLALVAGGMLWHQGRFDPAAWREQAQTKAVGEESRPAASPPMTSKAGQADAAAAVVPLSSVEHYGPDTLSDKIDGKAELYLSAGFRSLASRRFALAGDKSRWMERFVYDMGAFRNAFAVFSSQRRPHVQPVAWIGHGYLAGNALFFVRGPYYVEIVAAEASPAIQNGLESLAKAFIAAHPGQASDPPELGLFPLDHRVAHSVKLTARAAFGIQSLDWIFSAAYTDDRAEALAFISRRSSPAEAAALADRFHAFWLKFGGREIPPPPDAQGVRAVSILDNYEICLARGDYLIGVHEATDLDFGLGLVKQLQRNIAGAAR